MKIYVRVFVLLTAIYTVYSLCNSCSATTGLACVANDKYSVCINGLPSSAVIQCPSGTVCTATSQVCSPASTTAGSCSRCGTCDSNRAFACTSYRTFALCFGSTAPVSANFTCTGNLICNIDDPQICVDPSAGIGGTCPSSSASSSVSTTSTTTVSPAADPQAYCANLASSGRYEVTTDPYCKQYIFCTLYNNTWVGNVYECPGSTLFNSTTKLCGVGTPERCVQ